VLDKALTLEPRDPSAWFLRGEARRRLGDTEAAIADFEKSLEIESGSEDALFSLGTIAYLRQDFDRASVYFARLLALNGDHIGAHYGVGKILLKQGRAADAVPHLLVCVTKDPRGKGAHYQLAQAYRQLGEADKAQKELQVFRSLGGDANDANAVRIERLRKRPATGGGRDR
jgi:tetratricopeptide (TPR) repeat protein